MEAEILRILRKFPKRGLTVSGLTAHLEEERGCLGWWGGLEGALNRMLAAEQIQISIWGQIVHFKAK